MRKSRFNALGLAAATPKIRNARSKRNKRSKAFLSLDFMLAALLAATTAALLLYVFTSSAHSFALNSRSASLQASALAASEKALKQCAGEGGLARCERGMVFVNEFEPGFSQAAQQRFEAENGARVYLKTPPTQAASEDAKANTNTACVARIVLFGGEQRATHFCVTEGESK